MSEKMHPYWADLIAEEFANGQKVTGRQIEIKLADNHKKRQDEGLAYSTDPPGLKTIQRELVKLRELETSDPTALDKYRFFSWPQAMRNGWVPWEASESCFDLLRILPVRIRDQVPAALMEHYWRVKQSAPRVPLLDQLRLAMRWLLFDRRGFPAGVRWCQQIILLELWDRKLWTEERLQEIGVKEGETVWDLPPALFSIADKMGLVDVELALLDHTVAALRKENAADQERIEKGQLDVLGLAPMEGDHPKGILSPEYTSTEPGDEK